MYFSGKRFDYNVVKLGMHFLRRGYPIELLEEATLLARRKDRDCLLSKVADTTSSEEGDNRIFCITTFHPNYTSMKDIVFRNWKILGTSSTTTHIHQKKLKVGYKRPQNLRDVLVRAAIPLLANQTQTIKHA